MAMREWPYSWILNGLLQGTPICFCLQVPDRAPDSGRPEDTVARQTWPECQKRTQIRGHHVRVLARVSVGNRGSGPLSWRGLVHVDSGAAASWRLSGTPLAPEPCSFPGIAPAHLPPLSVRSPKGGSLSRVNSGEKRLSQKKKGKDLVILTICGI